MCVHFVNRRFCKLKEKAISFCGDLLGLLCIIQRGVPEVKITKVGVTWPFHYYHKRLLFSCLETGYQARYLKGLILASIFYFMEMLSRKFS